MNSVSTAQISLKGSDATRSGTIVWVGRRHYWLPTVSAWWRPAHGTVSVCVVVRRIEAVEILVLEPVHDQISPRSERSTTWS